MKRSMAQGKGGVPVRLAVAGLLALFLAGVFPQAQARAEDPVGDEAEVKALLDQAKKLGAKGQLPLAWWDLDAKLRTCREDGCSEGQWRTLKREATRLVNQASFIKEMNQKKSGMEALLGRFDQALAEVAALYGVKVDPSLSGSDAADDLLEKLNRKNLDLRVQQDSLTIANRYLTDTVGGRVVAQDSIITKLTLEVSSLRQRLWEVELRAGVAEADRSAAETALIRKQEKEAAIASIKSSIGPGAGEVLLTPEGDILLRITGIAFGVGSAELRMGQEVVVERVAGAVGLFPGSTVEVAGHTDDTGSRAANLRLSRRRAETVARLLEQQLGLDEGAIATEGYGPDRPVALNDSDEGRAKNRRIDVVIKPRD
jgi:outer membrane protein OmpA-like peptidoglycan-associated protein